jgi:hypothetical protein
VLTVERRAPLGMNNCIPADRACSSRSTATIPDPETPKTINLDFIVYVFFDTLSGTEPHQVGCQLAARIQGPDHSDAVASRRGYVFEIHRTLRAS